MSVRKTIVVLGTLDTRGDAVGYLKDRIESRGHVPRVMDVGVLGDVPFEPDFGRHMVAEAAGTSIEAIVALRHEGRAMSAMAEGAGKILRSLHEEGGVQGVIAAGGSMSTSLALEAIESLPLGLPKLILSTIAFSPLIPPDRVRYDLIMMQWPAGLYGLNRFSRAALDCAAGCISGAAEGFEGPGQRSLKKVVGVTSLGTSQLKYVETLKPELEKRGYEVAVFHSLGMGGKAFEEAVREGLIDVALDLSLVELMDQIKGGATAGSGPRLEAACERGIPLIVGAGAIGHFFWFSGEPLPPELADRKHHRHNQLLTIVVADTEDKRALGRVLAGKLKQARGPTAVVIPMTGWIEGDRHPRSPFHDPEGGRAFADALKAGLPSDIPVVELDGHINDPPFCKTILDLFDRMTGGS